MSGTGRGRVVIVSNRLTHDIRLLPVGPIRLRTRVVQDAVELDYAFSKGNVGLLVLDAAIPPWPGGFDGQDAAHWAAGRTDSDLPILTWLDGTPSSTHMAESVALELAGQEHRLAGCCGLGPQCLLRACAVVLAGNPWYDQHLGRDPLGLQRKRRLFTELQRGGATCDTLLGLAARPGATWDQLGRLFNREPDALRTALGKTIYPSIVEMGWIDRHERPRRDRLIALVHQRYAYFEHYVYRWRPALIPFFT